MVECIYRKGNLDLTYDTNEDTFYLGIDSGEDGGGIVYCTQDYTKEELITILKDMIVALED